MATNKVHGTFTEIIDINTEIDAPTILGIHTPIGQKPYNMLYGFFNQFKKYKYNGCSITIVPGSRLPRDPSAYGVVGGTNNADPKDIWDPILFKGCHGDSLGGILNEMYGGLLSDIFKTEGVDKVAPSKLLYDFYYTCLTDDSWKKGNVQQTLRLKGLHPLVYSMATNRQIQFGFQRTEETYDNNQDGSGLVGEGVNGSIYTTSGGVYGLPKNFPQYTGMFAGQDEEPKHVQDLSPRYVQQFFTSRLVGLGWLDTMNVLDTYESYNSPDASKIAVLPKVFMGLLVLPPAHKSYNYFRMIINHSFSFKDFRSVSEGGGFSDLTDPTYSPYYNKISAGVSPQPDTSKKAAEREEMVEEVDEDGYCE